MIRHLFRVKAEQLDPVTRMAAVAERLCDMGFQYDEAANNVLLDTLFEAAVEAGYEFPPQEKNFLPDHVWYYGRESCDHLTEWGAMVTRSGDRGELLHDDMVAIFVRYWSDTSACLSEEPAVKITQLQSVADFLAAPHPHPIQSSVARIANDVRGLFVR